jgi:ferredoxin
MMNMRYLNARWVLGWALVKHMLLRPFIRRDPSRWVDRIAADNLGPTPRRAWEYFEPASRCIGCGLCDAVVPPQVHASAWISGCARLPEDAPLALEKARLLKPWAEAIERVCPARVGVTALVQLIEDEAGALATNPLRK